jgi:peptidoglycan/LPS O-acetylase OafA/YrhL
VAYEITCHLAGRPFGLVPGLRPEVLQDLIVGLLFATHLLGAPALLRRLPPCPLTLARAIRFGAGSCFALYLLHYPIMLFLRAAMLRLAPGQSPLWLLPATAALCLAAAHITERRKATWRRMLEAVWRGGFGRRDGAS